MLKVLALLMFAGAASAQTTTFTLGVPTSNCIPVLSQNGVTIQPGTGAVCPQGFFGGTGWQISLPDGPTLTDCTANVGPLVPNGASATITTILSCIDPTWSGSIVQDFVQERVYCGRGRYCENYVEVGASGQLTTQ